MLQVINHRLGGSDADEGGLGQLHRATPSCPAPSVWGKTDKPGGPARGSKRTFVRFVSAFDPSAAQVCAAFGVKRTPRGRAGRLRVSSPGPPVGGTGRAFFYPPPPPSGRIHSTLPHSSPLSPSPPPAARCHCSRAPRTRACPAPSSRRRRATQARPPCLRTRRPDLGRIRSVLSSPGCGRPGRAMDWPGTSPEGPGRAARPHAGSGSSSSRSDLHRRWSAGRYTNGGRPGSVLAQKLAGAPLPLIKCDHCPRMVVRRVSTTPEHPGWVFIKCLNDGVCAFFSFGLCSRFD